MKTEEVRARSRSRPSPMKTHIEWDDATISKPQSVVVAKAVLTTQSDETHQPELIHQGDTEVLRTRCPDSALSALGEQIANVDQPVQHGSCEYDARDDPTLVLSLLAEYKVEKFDSGASRCMSGDPSRIARSQPLSRSVRITGFNGIGSSPTSMGVNADGKEEYYVEDMPAHLTLLCANAYCQDGCAVLFADGGLVLRMTKAELAALKEFLRNYPVVKQLKVHNRTYEVDQRDATHEAMTIIEVDEDRMRGPMQEDALSGTAARFFNTKVNVSNQEERILTLLMTGLTFRDLYMHVKNGSLSGVPPDLTMRSLNRFSHRFGRKPEILSLAMPINVRDATGLRDLPKEPDHVGERIEIDVMQSDYNLRESVPGTSNTSASLKTRKLPTHGGAVAAVVCVDSYSSYVMGKLVKSVADPEVFVEQFLKRFKLDNWPVSGLAADSGIVTNAQFQVMTTKVEELCAKWHVQKLERSLPYDHARITGGVEIEIQLIKRLIRMAITLILRNPNFPILGFPPIAIFKLWGEFYLWSIMVINLKPCPRIPTKSRWEVYHGKKPNMQDIRLLPIGCVIIVTRNPRAEGTQGDTFGGVVMNEQYAQVGIYVGPAAPTTPGAARVAVMTNGKLRILITSNFRAGTDGGGLNVYPHVERGLKQLLTEQMAISGGNDIEVDPEDEVPTSADAQPKSQGSEQMNVEPTDAKNVEAQGGDTQQGDDHTSGDQVKSSDQVTTTVESTVTAKVKKTRAKRGDGVKKGRPRKEVTGTAPASEPSSAQSTSVQAVSSEG